LTTPYFKAISYANTHTANYVKQPTMTSQSVVSPDEGQDRTIMTTPTCPITKKDATGSMLRASEKELAFILKIPNSEMNLAQVHKAFIDDLYFITDNEVTLLPSNERMTPVPNAVREPKDFSKNNSNHRAFFHRHTNQRNTMVFDVIIASLSINKLKKHLLLSLQA
jgi:hypothetical protein